MVIQLIQTEYKIMSNSVRLAISRMLAMAGTLGNEVRTGDFYGEASQELPPAKMRPSRNRPHQGRKECARRVRQANK